MSFGPLLIAALDRVAGIRPDPGFSEPYHTQAGARARVRYILAASTGASTATVAQLARVQRSTVSGWAGGKVPAPEYRGQVDDVYRRFLAINNRAKAEIARKRRARATALTVRLDALELRNTEGDRRYYKPSVRWWPALVAGWSHSDPDYCDAVWAAIIADWDYPEHWDADEIEELDIV